MWNSCCRFCTLFLFLRKLSRRDFEYTYYCCYQVTARVFVCYWWFGSVSFECVWASTSGIDCKSSTLTRVLCRDLHRTWDDGNPADSVGNPQEWGQILREYNGDGNGSCRDAAGWNLFFVETPSGCFRNLADDKNSVASVRTLVKLSRGCKMCRW